MAEQLRAGAATANITPWLGIPMRGAFRDVTHADAVHDDLLAKALVLDDGARRIAFVLCDLTMMPRTMMDGVKGAHRGALQHPGRPRAHRLDPHPFRSRCRDCRVHGGADRVHGLGDAQDRRRGRACRSASSAGPHRLCHRSRAPHRLQPPLPHEERAGALQPRRGQSGRPAARRHDRSGVYYLLRRERRGRTARGIGQLCPPLRGHGYGSGDFRRLLRPLLPGRPAPAWPADGRTALQRRFRQYQ